MNTEPEPPYPPIRYAWYVVGVLTLIYVFSFIDRQILNLIAPVIKKDLGVSDTQMGLLMGLGFAVFYTLFGIPIGRFADSGSRRGLITIGLVIWSAMTVGCGMARNYSQLLLARAGVGVGEATLSPSAYSMISDYFPKTQLATAISVYSMGIYIGSGMAMLVGGWVAGWVQTSGMVAFPFIGDVRSWQAVFLIVGLPGIPLALLLLTVKEPIRRGAYRTPGAGAASAPVQIPFRQVVNYIGQNWGTFLCHTIGFALIAFAAYAASSWVPMVFVRIHKWTPAQVGKVYGIIVMIFGTAGIVTGGRLADSMAKKGYRDSKMRVGMIAALGWIPGGILFPLATTGTWATIFLVPTAFFTAMPFGVAPAAIQEMMPPSMRAQAAAFYLFVINLIGLGLGPLAVGVLTDRLFHDEMRVHHSLLIATLSAQVLAAFFLWRGLPFFCGSMDRLKKWDAALK